MMSRARAVLAHLAAVIRPQFVELAPRVRSAAHTRHAALEAGLVAREPVGEEFALPGGLAVLAEEGARVFAAAGLAKADANPLGSRSTCYESSRQCTRCVRREC